MIMWVTALVGAGATFDIDAPTTDKLTQIVRSKTLDLFHSKSNLLKSVSKILAAGGVILGFEQMYIESGIIKRNTDNPKTINTPILIPTPWNNLEAGILFGLKLPLLIFKEDGIEGGVFDHGITDAFVHIMPPTNPDKDKLDELKQVFLKWFAYVSKKYDEY